MNFQICTGIQERAGVTKQGDIIYFPATQQKMPNAIWCCIPETMERL